MSATASGDLVRPPSVKGWCPGALKPMRTGDGLVVRLRLSGGSLTSDLARSIAAAATRFGNGAIDLSQRGNLQIRGVSDANWPDLIAVLQDLAVLDDDADVEAVRNIIASPLAGHDPSAAVDGRVMAARLEAAITADPIFRQLPGKFGALIDDGGAISLDRIPCDLRFLGVDGQLAVEIDGNAGEILRLGRIDPADIGPVAARMAAAFLALRGSAADAPRRLRGITRDRLAQFLAATGIDPSNVTARPHRPEPVTIGCLANPAAGPSAPALGLGIPFGRLSAATLAGLADIAAQFGSGEIRLTPFRSVLLPGAGQPAAVAAAATLGLIVAPEDPRLAVVACPGRPECESAVHAVRSDALALAPVASKLAGTGIRMHLSGCTKGCARPEATCVTLVAVEDGYDLIVDGRASGPAISTALARQDIEGALRRLGLVERTDT